MTNKRPWLGIRVPWHPVDTPRGKGRAAVVAFRKERLPWFAGSSHVTAVIFNNDFRFEFFAVQSVHDLGAVNPFWRLDRETTSLSSLGDLTIWPATEALYSGYSGLDIAEQYRSTFVVNEVIQEWRSHAVPGWWVVDRRGIGITLVRELVAISDGAAHAVELSYRGLKVYKHDLLRGSDLAERDEMLYLNILKLDLERLTRIFSKIDALAIRHAARHYRLMLFDLAAEYALPF